MRIMKCFVGRISFFYDVVRDLLKYLIFVNSLSFYDAHCFSEVGVNQMLI